MPNAVSARAGSDKGKRTLKHCLVRVSNTLNSDSKPVSVGKLSGLGE
jgi:hypothetical protein